MANPSGSDVMSGRLSRRRFGQLATLGLTTGTGSLGITPSAAAAGDDLRDGRFFYHRARQLAGDDPVLAALAASLVPGTELPDLPDQSPIRVFDDLAVLSSGFVSAMAVLTDDGIVLLDALGSPEDAERVIVGGLRELGLDPAAVTHVVVTHGHDDHFGGAQYLADRYGARVLMSAADWDLVERTAPENAPTRDLEIADGQRLTVGGTTFRLHHTPGHTAGTVSPVFPVRNGAERHTAMLIGGVNPPAAPGELRTFLASVHSFRRVLREAHVDVELSNHPNDHGLERAAELRQHPDGPNPWVLGEPRTQGFMRVLGLMLRGRLADAEAAGRG